MSEIQDRKNELEKNRKVNIELQSIEESLERLHRRLTRTLGAIDTLRKRKKYLLKPRKLNDDERLPGPLKVKSSDWHRIRDMELSDDIPDFLKRIQN